MYRNDFAIPMVRRFAVLRGEEAVKPPSNHETSLRDAPEGEVSFEPMCC